MRNANAVGLSNLPTAETRHEIFRPARTPGVHYLFTRLSAFVACTRQAAKNRERSQLRDPHLAVACV
jgi:hypothetical protein